MRGQLSSAPFHTHFHTNNSRAPAGTLSLDHYPLPIALISSSRLCSTAQSLARPASISGPPKLSHDILLLIIDSLASPSHPLAYALESHTLASLCVVSGSLHSPASAALYRSIVCHNGSCQTCVARTFRAWPDLAAHVHSIAFCFTAAPRGPGRAAVYAHYADELRTILDAVAPTASRRAASLGEWTVAGLRQCLGKAVHLEELVGEWFNSLAHLAIGHPACRRIAHPHIEHWDSRSWDPSIPFPALTHFVAGSRRDTLSSKMQDLVRSVERTPALQRVGMVLNWGPGPVLPRSVAELQEALAELARAERAWKWLAAWSVCDIMQSH